MCVTEESTKTAVRMPWKNCIAVGRAYELLRTDLIGHLRKLQKEIGYSYCRFHAVFHDDMNVVTEDGEGNIVYQWYHVDRVYDTLLELGLRPFVELNPMPEKLASGNKTMFFYKMNVTPPASYAMWEDLVYHFTAHLVERYGLEEIKKWYFEVWNEPNLSGFWSGSKEDYWKLYDVSARAVKRVDAQLKIGGPASSKACWIEDFIDHCIKTNTPIDFISTHLYPQDEYVDYHDREGSPYNVGGYFSETILNVQKKVQEKVQRFGLPDLEIHWTEWNTQSALSTDGITWSENRYVDELYAASFIVRNCMRLDSACDTLCYWVASDIFEEGGIPQSPFSCTYGLLTIHGIPKASYNAFSFLNKMRGHVCAVEGGADSFPGREVFATKEGEKIHLLINNYKALEKEGRPDWEDVVSFPFCAGDEYIMVTEKIRKYKGSPWETWLAMGKPQYLSHEQCRLLHDHAAPEYAVQIVSAKGGTLEIPFRLSDYEVLYLEMTPRESSAAAKGSGKGDTAEWDRLMGEKSR